MQEVMWEAVKTCDAAYDGAFFYAVKTTKIVCRPSCKSRTPSQHNVKYFPMFSMAVQEGFRPCKRCRPDLLVIPNEEAIIQTAQQMIEQEYGSNLTLHVLAKQVGMSKYHFQRLFQKKVGKSSLVYLTDIRLGKARQFLAETELSITQIGHAIGYNSSAHFSVLFRKQVGCAPTQYRNQVRGDQS
jgi:AraC family transcriptional regulator, regulatory protein of adaptative response / methylphosphotriester-DNA alkyltransferase methyltransferase